MDMESVFDRLRSTDPEAVDHRVVLHGVSWEQYVALSETRGGRPRPRMSYLDGALELMTHSFPHEYIKATLRRLLEVWAKAFDVTIESAGSYTVRNRRKRRGAEADECYYVGIANERRPPDLAIEIIWTHGGLDKLDLYRGLGVHEVWLWENQVLSVHVFERGKWSRRTHSKALPELDVGLLERCVRTGVQSKAVRMLERALKH